MRSIAALSFKGQLPMDRGPVPELRWLEISDLRVDESYQRPIYAKGEATIRRIVSQFDWRKFAPVVVCPIEGGVYAIVDGQHRTTAAKTIGLTQVPCMVIQADRQEQAKAFGAINGQVTSITAHALYRARLAALDPRALEVQALGRRLGVEIMTSNPSSRTLRPKQTPAFQAIERAIQAHGMESAEECLAALVASAADQPRVLSAMAVSAFCNVLIDHKEWRADPRLSVVSTAFDLGKEIQKAKVQAIKKRMPTLPLLEAALTQHLEECMR